MNAERGEVPVEAVVLMAYFLYSLIAVDITRCYTSASSSIVAIIKGFIAGCSDGGVRLYIMDPAEISNPSKMFECKQTWRVDTTADVVSGTCSVSSIPGSVFSCEVKAMQSYRPPRWWRGFPDCFFCRFEPR